MPPLTGWWLVLAGPALWTHAWPVYLGPVLRRAPVLELVLCGYHLEIHGGVSFPYVFSE